MRTQRLRRARTMQVGWWSLYVVGLFLAFPRTASAYVWMVRHGQTECASCHADPSGGELLNRNGRRNGWTLLPTHYGRRDDDGPQKPQHTGFLWGLWDTPDWLLLSGSVRLAGFKQVELSFFPMQLDAYGQIKLGIFRAGGSLGVAKVRSNSTNGRPAFVTHNQGDKVNMLSRTHWLALDLGAHRAWTLRAGRLNLPFGLRVPEHYLWVREATRTDRDADQQHGAAIAYNGSGIRAEAMAIAGNFQIHPDRYRERGYSGYVEYAFLERVAAGVSSLVTAAQADTASLVDAHTTRGVHGAFVRASPIKPLVVLAEFDLLHTSRRALGYVGYVQLDYEPISGVHVFATGELLDRGGRHVPSGAPPLPDVPGEGEPRLGGWLTADWFFLPQLEARFDMIARQDSGIYLLTQLHAYL